MPGVDLVEHQRRRRLGEHETQRQHRAGELAAGRGLGERPGRLARVRRQQEGHVVGAVVGRRARARPRPRGRGRGIASSRRCASTAVGERAGGRARGARSRAAAAAVAPRARRRRVRTLRARPRAASKPSSSARRATGLVGVARRTSASVSPYLRPSSRSSWRRRAHLPRAAPGSSATPSAGEPQLALEVGELGLQRPQAARAASANGARSSSAATRRADARRAPALRARRTRVGERLAVRDGVGEERLLGLEGDVLAGIVDARGSSISSIWKRSRSISRARARSSPPSAASSASHCARLGARRAAARRAPSSAGSPANRSSARALHRRRRAATGARAGRAGRRARARPRRARATVASRPSTYARDAPVARDARVRARLSSPVVGVEATLDARLAGALAHERGVGAAAERAARAPRRAASCPHRSRR